MFMGSAGAIVLYTKQVLRNSMEYNNHMRTRVIVETRTFLQVAAFSSRSWGVSLIGPGLFVFVSLLSIVKAF